MYADEMVISSLVVKELVMVNDVCTEWLVNARLNEGYAVTQMSKLDIAGYGYSLELQWMHNITLIYTITPSLKHRAGTLYLLVMPSLSKLCISCVYI